MEEVMLVAIIITNIRVCHIKSKLIRYVDGDYYCLELTAENRQVDTYHAAFTCRYVVLKSLGVFQGCVRY